VTARIKLLLSIAIIIFGWLLNAVAWTIATGPAVSSICLLLGVGMMAGGIVLLIKR